MSSLKPTRLKFPLAVDQGLGRLREEPSADAYIEQLIRQVILTAPGERVHRPDFGGGLMRQVFAISSFAGALRIPLMALLVTIGSGAALIYATPWVIRGLSQFNNYSLAPVLLVVLVLIGVVADRK